MWHFYWRSIRRIPSLAVEAVKRIDTFVGLLTICVWVFIGGTVAGAWWQSLPWQVPVVAFIAFLIYGFLRAVYQEYATVENERDSLRQERETEEERAAILLTLHRHYREGEALRAEMVNNTDESHIGALLERFDAWYQGIGNYLAENVSVGKAEYVVGTLSLNAAIIRGVHPDLNDAVRHLGVRLERLAEVMKDY
jgi:hypothetical protein